MDSLNIKSKATGKIVSIPRGTKFIIYPWGFSEVDAEYTKDGRIVIYRTGIFTKGNKRFLKTVISEQYESAEKFLSRWDKDVIIENKYGMDEDTYWDIAIYTKG